MNAWPPPSRPRGITTATWSQKERDMSMEKWFAKRCPRRWCGCGGAIKENECASDATLQERQPCAYNHPRGKSDNSSFSENSNKACRGGVAPRCTRERSRGTTH